MADASEDRGKRGWRSTGRRIVVRLAAVGVLAAMLYTELWGAVRPEITSSVLAIAGFAHIFMASFWHYLGFAAGGCLVLALLLRMRWTAVLACVLLLIGLGPWGVSYLSDPKPADGDQPTLTVLSANLLYSLDDLSLLEEQIDALDPDVVLLQEVHESHEQALRTMFADWGGIAIAARSDAFGQAVFSREPFAEAPLISPVGVTAPSEGSPPQIACDLSFDGSVVQIVNVHIFPPGGVRNMIVQDAMARGLAELAAASDADAMIMAGDFNSPERGQPVRRVRAAGLRSVHASRGRGLGATWPRVTWLKHLPGTRIDQILFRDLEVIDCGVGEDFGSDHRPVWAVFQAP